MDGIQDTGIAQPLSGALGAEMPGIDLAAILDLPEGTVITDIELTLRGKLPLSKS